MRRHSKNNAIRTFIIYAFGLLWSAGISAPVMAEAVWQSQVGDSQLVFAITEVRDRAKPQLGKLSPQEGHRFVAVQILLDNTQGKEAESVVSLCVHLEDANGNRYAESVTLLLKKMDSQIEDMISAMGLPTFEPQEIAPGGSASGWLFYEIPIDLPLTDLKMRYDAFVKKSKWLYLSGNAPEKDHAGPAQSAIDDGNTILRISDIKDSVTSNNILTAPKEGHRLLAVQVELDNTAGKKPAGAALLSFKMKDTEGREYSPEFMGAVEPSFDASDVRPGATYSGWMTFNIPLAFGLDSLWLRYDGLFENSDWIALAEAPVSKPPAARTLEELLELGRGKEEQSQYAEARVYYEEALRLAPRNATLLVSLGIVSFLLDEYQTALQWYEKALHLQKTTLGERHPDVAKTLANIGILYASSGDRHTALDFYEQALDIQHEAYGENHISVGKTLVSIGNAKRELQSYQKAIDAYEQALAIFREAYGGTHPEVGQTLSEMATTWVALQEYELAIGALKEAVSIARELYGGNHPKVGSMYANLGSIYQQNGETQNALTAFKQAEAIFAEQLGEEHEYTGMVRNTIHSLETSSQGSVQARPEEETASELGWAAYDEREYEQAIKYFTQAIAEAPDDPQSYFARAEAYEALEAWEAAILDYSNAIELAPGNFFVDDADDSKLTEDERQEQNAALENEAIAYAYYRRGNASITLGDIEQGASDYYTALELSPGSEFVQDIYAHWKILYEEGRIAPQEFEDEMLPDGWQTFTSEEHGFAIAFPGAPKETLQEIVTEYGIIKVYNFSVQDAEDSYTFVYFEMPVNLESPQDSFEESRRQLIDKMKVTDVKDTPVFFKQHPGRQLDLKIPGPSGTVEVKAQLYFAGPRKFYQLVVAPAIPEKKVLSEESRAFFHSFRILE